MRINTRLMSHIEIGQKGDLFYARFISTNGRQMGQPDWTQTREEALQAARDWAHQIHSGRNIILSIIERN